METVEESRVVFFSRLFGEIVKTYKIYCMERKFYHLSEVLVMV